MVCKAIGINSPARNLCLDFPHSMEMGYNEGLDSADVGTKFLFSKTESKKKYTKVLRSLEKGGSKLVSMILQDLISIENEETSVASVKCNRIMTTVDTITAYLAGYINQLLLILFFLVFAWFVLRIIFYDQPW